VKNKVFTRLYTFTSGAMAFDITQCHVWKKTPTEHVRTNTSCQLACFAVTSGHLAVIESTVNFPVYQNILESHLRPSDNGPKHTSKSSTEWLKNKKIKVLKWPKPRPQPDSNTVMNESNAVKECGPK
uniref:Uncharacterized protein n=1 Tax=Oreochromis aureus TaxID=47969 RepID=A0AAZ1XYE1_OREAU